jgi:hypothetical protein
MGARGDRPACGLCGGSGFAALGCAGARQGGEVQPLRDRRVADSPLGAALVGHPDLPQAGQRRAGHDGLHGVVIDLGWPEVRVVLGLRGRRADGKLRAGTGLGADPVSVEVGAGRDGPAQVQGEVRVAGRDEGEGRLPHGGVLGPSRRPRRGASPDQGGEDEAGEHVRHRRGPDRPAAGPKRSLSQA